MKNAYDKYRTANVDTADQGKLIIIAYDIAIKNCKLSLDYFNSYKDIENRNKHLYKVQDALSELMSSLNMEVGEISTNLYKLYEYMIHRTVIANTKSDPEPIREVLKYLEDLRDAWKVAIQKVKEESREATQTKTDGNFKSIAISG